MAHSILHNAVEALVDDLTLALANGGREGVLSALEEVFSCPEHASRVEPPRTVLVLARLPLPDST